MHAANGAEIETWVFIHKNQTKTSLLRKEDALRLGIVKLNLKGTEKEVIPTANDETIGSMSDATGIPDGVPREEHQEEIDARMTQMKLKYHSVFSDRTGKFKGKPIPIQLRHDAIPFYTTS